MQKHILSKSTFVRGMQCEKSLWLNKYKSEVREEISDAQQAIFDRGHLVGDLAQTLFPGGVLVIPEGSYPSAVYAQRTLDLINEGVEILYEPCFLFDEVLCAMDIMVKSNGKWYAYEVKSSSKVTDTYILDASLQSYLIENSGVNLADLSIVHINNQYVRNGEIDVHELFTIESILEKSKELQKAIPARIARLKEVISQNEELQTEIGAHCSSPYECDFMNYCWPELPQPNVFQIVRLKSDKKLELYNQGIVSLDDIPDNMLFSTKQHTQIEAYKQNRKHVDKVAIRGFISDLQYPLYFLDFETMQSPIPLFDNSRPYQQICTQYSLHIQQTPDSEYEHCAFLAETIGDPRIPFIEQLIAEIGTCGNVIVYNKGFECGRLKEIAELFSQYASKINAIVVRVVDLMTPFLQQWLYYPEMNGSYSIKRVLPALVPELSYKGLEIGDGGAAMSAFESLYYETDSEKIAQVRNALLEYCKLDTWAMVKILEKLDEL